MSELATISTYLIFIASYAVFALGKFQGMKIDRPGAAIIGAVLMFTTGAVRASNALYLVHFGTVVLLFSMMRSLASTIAGFPLSASPLPMNNSRNSPESRRAPVEPFQERHHSPKQ